MSKTSIVVTLRVEGIHCWADCPLEQVKYLRDPHRHVFWIKATKAVTHDDRDVEIIMFKEKIATSLSMAYYDHSLRCCNFGTKSCEMLAKELLENYYLDSCEVLEDGENGAIVYA
jgi:hypothetical protein